MIRLAPDRAPRCAARRVRSGRRAGSLSSTLMSIHWCAFDTPMRSANRADGLRRCSRADASPRCVGMRGSSQPSTWLALDQLDQLALAHHGVGQVQAREFVLLRQWPLQQTGFGEPLDHPVVERSVVLEFQRTQRMGDALDRIRDAMGVVVERIHAPLVAGAVMRRTWRIR